MEFEKWIGAEPQVFAMFLLEGLKWMRLGGNAVEGYSVVQKAEREGSGFFGLRAALGFRFLFLCWFEPYFFVRLTSASLSVNSLWFF